VTRRPGRRARTIPGRHAGDACQTRAGSLRTRAKPSLEQPAGLAAGQEGRLERPASVFGLLTRERQGLYWRQVTRETRM